VKFCKVADITDWQDQEFRSISSLLDVDGFKDRKVWEHIQVYRGLQQLGLLNENTRALGLGVGQERLIYAFSNVCGAVVATDLYNSSNWSTASLSVEEVYDQSTFPYHRDRLTVRHMDMTQIEFPDASFDVVWSCCSIEHVNSFADLHQVYREIHRVLKPGGVAALTTEYNLSDHHSYDPNMLFTDRYWIEHWLTGENPLIEGFELIDQPDLSLVADPGNEPQPRRLALKTSIPIYSRDIVLDSVAFFLRKSGNFSRDYDDRWLPSALRQYLSACGQLRAQNFIAAEALLNPLIDSETIEPRLKVAVLRRLMTALREQNKTAEMLQYCQAIVPLCESAQDTDHLLPLAHICKKLKQWDIAQFLYEKTEQSPGARDIQVVRSLLGQAECLAQQNQFQAALELTEKAQDQLPPYHPVNELIVSVHYHRGLYHEKLEHFQEAMSAYQVALHSVPNPKMQQNITQRSHHCQTALREQSFSYRMNAKFHKLLNQARNVIKL
jgi:SAM-dependent methyltransferase